MRLPSDSWAIPGNSAIMLGESQPRPKTYLNYFCCVLPARACGAAFTWETSRKFWYSLLTVSILSAKTLHIYAHADSIKLRDLILWGPTFFVQDLLFLLFAFALAHNFQRKWFRYVTATATIAGALALSTMSAANISFFFTTGAEIHWRQAGGFNRDPASINTLMTGLTGLAIVDTLFFVGAALMTPWIYNGVDAMISIWGATIKAIVQPVAPYAKAGLRKVLNRWGKGRDVFERLKLYEAVPLSDYDEADDKTTTSGAPLLNHPSQAFDNLRHQGAHWASNVNWKLWLTRALIIVPTLYVFIVRICRPSISSYGFLSQTVIVTPFVSVAAESALAKAFPERELYGKTTALTAVPVFDWVPKGKYPGFRDWEDRSRYSHYNSTEDPLHISNLDLEILAPIKKALDSGDVKIKHIFVFKMESTRYDVFPLRNSSYLWNRLETSYKGNKFPHDVQDRLVNLTRTAERLTGQSSGFHRNETIKPYGGINMHNSYTGGTFTLKSIEATTCGVEPLVVDFNHEYEHHIYQPCMPHILDMLSTLTNNSHSKDFTHWPWRPAFMQSITDTYDHQDRLTPALGFKPENIVTVESIDQEHANDTSWTAEKFNFWGYPDSALASYFRTAIEKAERDHERLFLTHLTGITHHPWDTPGHKYEELIGPQKNVFGGGNDDLNRYLNTIGVNDRWFETFLDILEETGVANETLVVMTGDHGISLVEDGNVTPYDNPLETNFHVPLVFANPRLPVLQLNASVTSIQILPTILDLLKHSGSLDKKGSRAVSDLLPMYEGQSILRPIITHNDQTPWYQFTVMNTGGSLVAMRAANAPYRLVVPLVPEVEFRFTDLSRDPREVHPIKAFDFESLQKAVKATHGEETAQWLHDAARAAQWWVTDNWHRYEFNPLAPKKPHESWPSSHDGH
ncbi:hypothetical protein N7539_008202 [Penicillium diatomitis]|uniref:Sulfatase N-terminal domain-containing protein n=1 Tax=Penicillium diatomitis TaxID=2819901 RepID=A0A9X0BMY2_9EURO|nr:uncharacterized protein N7539_008202 [Penicillium diatomitis]KAJ5475136.1 hypothetical protein N7539_008202 [Penicillium diatomitis]